MPEHFIDDSKLRDVTRSILDTIDSKADLDAAARYGLDTCLSEMLENVIFHADAANGGVTAVQAFASGELEVAIVDLGVGIPASLALNPDYADLATRDDLTAVQTAMVPNVTSTPWRNAGWGLAFTELLLGLNGGRLLVRSGAGHVMRGAKIVDRLDTDQPQPGTLVAMRIKTDRPLDYSRAWDLLAEVADSVDHNDLANGSRDEAG